MNRSGLHGGRREGESPGQCIVTKNVHGCFDIPRIIFPYLEDFKFMLEPENS